VSSQDDVYREALHDWLAEREPPERPSAQELAELEELERNKPRSSASEPTGGRDPRSRPAR